MLLRELRHPIVLAPLAGGPATPALAAAVCEAGGLGFLAAGYRRADDVRAEVRDFRGRTALPFGLNLFVPGDPAELAVPAALTQKWPALTGLHGAPAYNVGRAYASFAADINNGTHAVPDFDDAVRRHEVIAAIERSAASGERVKA